MTEQKYRYSLRSPCKCLFSSVELQSYFGRETGNGFPSYRYCERDVCLPITQVSITVMQKCLTAPSIKGEETAILWYDRSFLNPHTQRCPKCRSNLPDHWLLRFPYPHSSYDLDANSFANLIDVTNYGDTSSWVFWLFCCTTITSVKKTDLVTFVTFVRHNSRLDYFVDLNSEKTIDKIEMNEVPLGYIEGMCKEIAATFDYVERKFITLAYIVHRIYGAEKSHFEPFRFF